jgi:transposase InsO family protein
VDKARFLVEAHLREGRPVLELAAAHGVHFSWIYRLLERYREEGDAGLEARSRRPHGSPTSTPVALENEIVLVRKHLQDEGLDAGAQTIRVHLERRHETAPSVSTIMRVLRRRGMVVYEPRKRPKSSYVRFEAPLPNGCWQTDMTHWALRSGRKVEILNFIDDHSRLCIASVALAVTKTTDVVRVFNEARDIYGTPASVLSDNGAIYTGKYRLGRVLFECELERLHVTFKHSKPNHPQTCGKAERFHQTEKKFLARQDPPRTLAQLQAQIDRFVAYYNTVRPHRSLGRKTPLEVYEAKVKAHPITAGNDTHCRIRHDRVDWCGKLTIRYEGKLRHIGMGAPFKGLRVVMLVADAEVRVLSTGGDLLRTLTLDPDLDYHPQTLGWASTMSRHIIR